MRGDANQVQLRGGAGGVIEEVLLPSAASKTTWREYVNAPPAGKVGIRLRTHADTSRRKPRLQTLEIPAR